MNYKFPLREDLTVVFQNLPRNLTKEEVLRLIRFLEMLMVKE